MENKAIMIALLGILGAAGASATIIFVIAPLLTQPYEVEPPLFATFEPDLDQLNDPAFMAELRRQNSIDAVRPPDPWLKTPPPGPYDSYAQDTKGRHFQMLDDWLDGRSCGSLCRQNLVNVLLVHGFQYFRGPGTHTPVLPIAGIIGINFDGVEMYRLPIPELKFLWPRLLGLSLRNVKVDKGLEDVTELRYLTVLAMENNRIKKFPYYLGRLPHLKYLYLSNNSIKEISFDPEDDPDFTPFAELDTLYIHGTNNRIRNLWNLAKGMPMLRAIVVQTEDDADRWRRILDCGEGNNQRVVVLSKDFWMDR